jgi:hypothetical protein
MLLRVRTKTLLISLVASSGSERVKQSVVNLIMLRDPLSRGRAKWVEMQ